MARAKNTNKLSSAFYKAHDFLRFGDVLTDIKLARKGDYQNSLKQMEILQSVNRLGFEFPKIIGNAIHGPDYIEDIFHYGNRCNMEYEAWINSLKFQFEAGLLNKVIPPNAILNNFFSDLEMRMPHEQTLLIENHPSGITTMVRVEETSIRSWHRNYIDLKEIIAQDQDVNNEKQFYDRLEKILKAERKDENDNTVRIYPWFESFDQELAAFTLTINCDVGLNEIEEPNRFMKDQLNAFTSNTSVLIPHTFFVPIGKTVKFYDRVNPVNVTTLLRTQKNHDLYHLSCAFLNPFSSPGFYNESFFKKNYFDSNASYPFWTNDDYKKELKKRPDFVNRKHNSAIQSHWWLARQTFLHMGIMNHPEFKSLCVEKLKMNGIQPNKSPFSAARPYETRPGWRPPFEHYVVTINIPDEISKESNASTMRKRHHLVRGHYMRTASKGFVWRKSHWRGNREMGVVTKDYVMDLEDKLQKTGRNDEKNIALNLRG